MIAGETTNRRAGLQISVPMKQLIAEPACKYKNLGEAVLKLGERR
jgi:hypothetical protein